MKVRITQVPPGSQQKVGDLIDIKADEFAPLSEGGFAITATEWDAKQQAETVKASQKSADEAVIKAAVQKAKDRGAIPPKDTAVETEALAQFVRGNEPKLIVSLLDGLKAKADDDMGKRWTSDAPNGEARPEIKVTGTDPRDSAAGYIKAVQPQSNLIKTGRWDEARLCGVEANVPLMEIIKAVDSGADFSLRGLVKATTATAGSVSSDPDSQLGYLSTGLIIMRNLGFLAKQIAFINRMTTNLSNEPARFGEPIYTRYFTLPDLLTYVPGVGFTSDSGSISGASVGTTQAGGTLYPSGTRTTSVPNATDANVIMNMFKAVEIELPYTKMASTVRNLLGEQRGAQIYKLGDAVARYVLETAMAATWTAASGAAFVKALANWDIGSLVDLKAALDVSEIPNVGRFAIVHTFYANRLLKDGNMLQAKAILSLINKDLAEFESEDIPALFGLKPYSSQYASGVTAGTYVAWTDPSNLGTTAITGFAGNPASMLFVSRVPQDWTGILTALNIPLTSSVEIVTEPESGLSVMVFKYADNGKMSVVQRVCLMWGAKQGDPRQGMLIKPA